MRIRHVLSLLVLVAANRPLAAQQPLALASRAPRFLYAAAPGTKPIEIDARRNRVLSRVVSLRVEQPTVGRLLTAIERQTGLTFAYDTKLRLDRPLTLRADSITIASALAAILYDAGVDVVLSSGGQVVFVAASRQWPVQGGSVIGHVTDSKTGDGISGVDVSLEGTRWRTTTDASGRYRLAEVSPGRYTALARRIGYTPERRAVTVTVGQETALDVALHPAATKLGDVVVTAQKREERLQDVPLSIAVVTPEEIDRRGLVSAEDYLRGIPGVSQTSGNQGETIVVRGLTTELRNQNLAGGTTVATYFGETPTTNSAGLLGGTNVDAKLVDIERVEVLRGPQGTAFGSASLGGAVRTIPVAPKLDRFEGKVASSYSVTSGTGSDNYSIQGVGNFPLIKDKLALRAVGFRFENSGFYRNVAGSDPAYQAAVASAGAQAFAADDEEVGTRRFTGGRIAAQFQASDPLKFTLSYLTQKTEQDGWAVATREGYDGTVLQVAPEHVVRRQTAGVFDTDIDLANAMMEYDLGWANLLATYSYTNSGSVLMLPISAYSTAPTPYSSGLTSEHRAHVGEVRLTTQLDGKLNFLAGLYAEELEDESYQEDLWAVAGTNPFAPGQQFIFDSRSQRNDTQKAAFAEASWEFLPGTTLTGGARVYDYDRTRRRVLSGAFGASTSLIKADASGTSLRGNLSHKFNDNALIYAGWSEGFRLGFPTAGLPPSCDVDSDGIVDGTSNFTMAQAATVDADHVDNYELGGKFTLLDRRAMIMADVFRIDWYDLPVTVRASDIGANSICAFPFLQNAGAARSEGIEFQANVYVTEAIRVDIGGSYVRARLTKDAPRLAPPAFAGDPLPGSPEFNAHLGLQYEFKIGGAPAFVRADPIYVGPFYGNLQRSPNTKSGDYVKVDASARVALRYLDVNLFVRNLTNADDFTFRGVLENGGFFGHRLQPRMIGLQLSRNL